MILARLRGAGRWALLAVLAPGLIGLAPVGAEAKRIKIRIRSDPGGAWSIRRAAGADARRAARAGEAGPLGGTAAPAAAAVCLYRRLLSQRSGAGWGTRRAWGATPQRVFGPRSGGPIGTCQPTGAAGAQR